MSCRMFFFFFWHVQSSHMFCSFSSESHVLISKREKETALNFITLTNTETLFDLTSFFALSCIFSLKIRASALGMIFALCWYTSAGAVRQVYLIRVDGSSQVLHPFVSLCRWTTRKALATCGGAHLEKRGYYLSAYCRNLMASSLLATKANLCHALMSCEKKQNAKLNYINWLIVSAQTQHLKTELRKLDIDNHTSVTRHHKLWKK